MMAAWVLILYVATYKYGIAYEKIPMKSQESCMVARNILMDNGIADKAICVPTGYDDGKR